MELKENKDLLQTVFDSASNGIAVMQSIYNEKGGVKDFSILLFNAYTLNWIGDIDYKGKLYGDVFPKVKETGILDKFIEAAETGVTATFERWYAGEGMKHWFRFTAVKQGELLVITTEDITERKKAEIALGKALEAAEKQQRLYNSVTNNTPDLVYVFDLDYRFTYANKALLTMWGKPAEDAVGKGLRENGYEEWHAQMHEREIDEVVATKKSIRGTVSFPHAELGKRVYDYIFAPVFNEQGEVEAIAGTTRDITDIKRAEEAIMESESRFRNLVRDASAAIIVVTGPEMKVEIVNEAYVQLIERTTDEVWGKELFSVIPEAEATFRPVLDSVRLSGEPLHLYDTPYAVKKDGRKIEGFLNLVYQPYHNSEGHITGVMVLCQNVTESVKTRKALEESESRLRNVISTTTVGTTILTGPEMKVEVANDVILKFWQRDNSIIGKPLTQAIPELVGQPFPELLAGVYNTGVTYTDNEALTYFLNAEGVLVPVYFNYSYTALRETNGTIYGVLITAIEVTEEILSKKRLEESESRFRTLANDTPAFMFTADAETNLDFANRQWLNFVGLTSEKGLGKAWETITHPDDVEPMYAIYSDAVKTLKPYQFEIRQRRADGAYRWVLWKGIPRKTADGKFAGMMGVGLDVTSQKEVQEIIKESESRFRLLSDEMPQFVWTGDANGNLGYFNQAVYDYSGLSREDIANEGWIQIVHPEDREENIRLWLQSIATGKNFIFEHRFKRADGKYRWQLSRAVPQKDAHGVIQQWIGTSTDIQDQKNVEERLEKLVAERTKELQRSNNDLQQFAHVASHDLKEPVRKIKMFTDRLEQHLNGLLDETGSLFIKKIDVATDRMRIMIDGVLTYASTNAGTQIPKDVDLNDTIKNIENDLEVALQKTSAIIYCNHLPTLQGAPVLLYQLFYNLINNSIKFAKDGVPLQIKITSEVFVEDNKYFSRITLCDNGIGFEPQHSQRIFETFTRLNSKDKYEGTGLGLSLCKKIVERHGGSIIANGTPGEGAAFTVTLPMQQKTGDI